MINLCECDGTCFTISVVQSLLSIYQQELTIAKKKHYCFYNKIKQLK